jgi:putative sterol carrier protein
MEVISNPEPGKLNILALILRELFLKKGKSINVKRNFSVGIKAGKMASTLIFKEGLLEIKNGISDKTNCLIEGSLGTFLSLTSKSPFFPFFKGELKIRGNPLTLLHFLKIINSVLRSEK